jgi:hypothetical protein
VVTDRDAGNNDRATTNPNVIAQSRGGDPHRRVLIDRMVIGVVDRNEVADPAIVADRYLIMSNQGHPLVDEHTVADRELAARLCADLTSRGKRPERDSTQ